MTDSFEDLREDQERMDQTTALARRVDLILDNAACFANEDCFAPHAPNRYNGDRWHKIAFDHVRTQLAASHSKELHAWFAQHGVKP